MAQCALSRQQATSSDFVADSEESIGAEKRLAESQKLNPRQACCSFLRKEAVGRAYIGLFRAACQEILICALCLIAFNLVECPPV